MKKTTLITVSLVILCSIAFAQRSDLDKQKAVQEKYSSEHYNTTGGSHVDVSHDKDGTTVKESWKSSNGDKNTITRDKNTNHTTTEIIHPDGTKEVNGVSVGGEKAGGEKAGGEKAGGETGGDKGGETERHVHEPHDPNY